MILNSKFPEVAKIEIIVRVHLRNNLDEHDITPHSYTYDAKTISIENFKLTADLCNNSL